MSIGQWSLAPVEQSSVGRSASHHPCAGTESSGYGPKGERLVAGIVAVSADRKRVLLVQSQSKKGWVFPKGGWETDEPTAEEAAKREAWEEAGIEVDVIRSLGIIIDNDVKPSKHLQANGESETKCANGDDCTKDGSNADNTADKASGKSCSKGFYQRTCSFEFFEALVNKELDEYPEMRPRRWCTYEESLELLRKRPELIEALNLCSVERPS